MRNDANDAFENRGKGVVHIGNLLVGFRNGLGQSARTRTGRGHRIGVEQRGRRQRETARARCEITGD
jgi:hypothetical protein